MAYVHRRNLQNTSTSAKPHMTSKQQHVENRAREKSSSRTLKAAKVKPEKLYMQPVYHRFCSAKGSFIKCAISGGVRRVNLLQVADEKFLTTIGSDNRSM